MNNFKIYPLEKQEPNRRYFEKFFEWQALIFLNLSLLFIAF